MTGIPDPLELLPALRRFFPDVRVVDGVLGGFEAKCPNHPNAKVYIKVNGTIVGCSSGCDRWKITRIQGHEGPPGEDPPPLGIEGAATGPDEKPKKGALSLVRLADACELFVDDREEAFAAIPLNGGGREVQRIHHRYFKGWLLHGHYNETKQAAGKDAVDSAVRLLEARARMEGRRVRLTERFASEAGPVLWIDLGDDSWRAVRVTADGWTIEPEPPILFRRHEHTAALPDPIGGGSIAELFGFLNMKEEADRIGLLAWMVAVFFADVPRPILGLHGVQGAAKTTTARVVRGLLDPSRTEVLGPPRTEEALLHQLGKHAVPTYDNLSMIPDWMADAFCRAVTGAASEKRLLYSDGESVLTSYKRAIILTGINSPSNAPDLLSRALSLELEAVSTDARREEGEFWAAFNEARPRLFGALLDAVSATLRQLPNTHPPRLQRMADFTRIGAAAAEALGYGEGLFLDAYTKAADRQTAEQLDTDAVAMALRAFMARRKQLEWVGTTGDLFKELRPDDRYSGFPKNAEWLGRRLNILRPVLAQAGLEVEPAKLDDHGRGWRVRGRL